MKKSLVLSLLLMSAVPVVSAAEISGVKFNDSYQAGPVIMQLQGTGLKTVLFFKAFVAGYYTDTTVPADEIGQFPQRIEVQYFVNIPGKKLNDYTLERMKFNVSQEELEKLKAQTDLMANYFVDLKPGDRFALTYLPRVGTKFEHNGQMTGSIAGSGFARALFAVWIGEKPFDEALKQRILGGGKLVVGTMEKIVLDKKPDQEQEITPGYSSRIIRFGPQETTMHGSIKYSVIGRYNAYFEDFKGSIAVDEASKDIRSVILEINAVSILSECLWCDNIVRSPKVLNTVKYPKIVFKGNEIINSGNGFNIKGTLEMHGKAREVTFPFQFDLDKDVASGQQVLKMKGKWNINRKDFDVIWNRLLDHGGILVGDYILVEWAINIKTP